MSKVPYVVAHRGVSAFYPENTLVAFQAAVELGVDWIELDVVTTSDNIVIVSHDTTADRCTDGSGVFKDMRLNQVKALDAGSWFAQRFAGERIPTLSEVISLIANTSVRLCIEIKGDTPTDSLATAYATVTLLREHNFFHQSSVASFDAACLQIIRSLEPRITVNLDPTPQDGSLSAEEMCQQCLHCNANFMSHTYETLTSVHVDAAHTHGLALWAWTVNDAASMRHLITLGVDGILSDDPEKLKNLLLG